MDSPLKRHGSGRRRGIAARRIGCIEGLETRYLLTSNGMESGDHGVADHGCEEDHHDAEEHGHGQAFISDEFGCYYLHATPVFGDGVFAEADNAIGGESLGGYTRTVTIDDIPILHSNPDAEQKIYLDFNGQNISGTGWNESNNGRVIQASAFDNDGDPLTFSPAELNVIDRIWQRVSEDFSPFNIDVTTESPSSRDFREGRKAIRVMISTNVDELTGNQWFASAGGVAYVGSWRATSDTPVWVFENNLGGNEKRIAEAVSHEVGHAFGLHHDGTLDGDEYFGGYGTGRTGWAPIMGAGYNRAVTQWSRGEYDNASNTESDLAIITSNANRIQYRRDDHRNTRGSATRLEPNSDGELEMAGVIHTGRDRDVFVLEMGAGELELDIDGIRFGTNIDLKATVYDAEGDVIEEFNPERRLNVDVNMDLPAGTYFVYVEGAGFGDPVADGYSAYGSIGQYTITGEYPAQEVDIFELLLAMQRNFGSVSATAEEGDLNGDNVIDFADFMQLSQVAAERNALGSAAESLAASASTAMSTDEELRSLDATDRQPQDADAALIQYLAEVPGI